MKLSEGREGWCVSLCGEVFPATESPDVALYDIFESLADAKAEGDIRKQEFDNDLVTVRLVRAWERWMKKR